MKLQFAFGNPRKGKSKHKRKNPVAKRRKKANPNGVKFKLQKAVQEMAKRKGRRKGRRKNPTMVAFRDGKRIASAKIMTEGAVRQKVNADPQYKKLMGQLTNTPFEKRAEVRKRLGPQILAIHKRISGKYLPDIEAKQAYMEKLKSSGATIKSYADKEKPVAKTTTKKTTKKGTKKTTKKGAKKTTKKGVKKTTKKGAKKTTKKGTKKRSAAQKRALKKMQAAAKKARNAKKGRKPKKSTKGRRRYPKMIRHTHSKKMRHIRKGSSAKIKSQKRKGRYKVSTYFGKGKKKVRMSGSVRVTKKGLFGRLKINPFGRNPMNKYAKAAIGGLSQKDLISVAAGGVAVPVINQLFAKFAPGVASKVASVVGPQLAGSALPIIAGVLGNVAMEAMNMSESDKKKYQVVTDGLLVAGVIGAAMSLTQQYASKIPGLSGILYTPGMSGMGIMPQLSGINYTPGMRGINYTPGMSGGMGIMPQLGRSPDFGSANYGGGGGSREAVTQRSDFGAWQSEDSEAGFDEENSYSSSMN